MPPLLQNLLDPALWALVGGAVYKLVDVAVDRFFTSADARLDDESKFRGQLIEMASTQSELVESMSKSLAELSKAYNDSQALNSKMDREIKELRQINKDLSDKVSRLEVLVMAQQGEK